MALNVARPENRLIQGPLLTDLYELTMAFGYWKHGMANRTAAFHLFFRDLPFEGNYAVASGLEEAAAFIESYSFSDDELEYLEKLENAEGEPLFEKDFIEYLRHEPFRCNIEIVPEGSLVFPNEPLARVIGPLAQAQIIESALLCILNFNTLAATKASRICAAAGDSKVIDFGLRRAQGVNGAMAASRAAYLGGCIGTSNTLAGRFYDIPVKGTHAHSWVMAFENEAASFDAYAEAMPGNCLFLIDTYETETGIQNAIESARRLRRKGHEIIGVRLDSGDLHQLSHMVRERLDAAGFPQAKIVASDELDEYAISDLRQRGAPIDLWGVGTRLAACSDDPALNGVYKLGAIQDEKGIWQARMKGSDAPEKSTLPGLLEARRLIDKDGQFSGDAIWSELEGPPEGSDGIDLLSPVFEEGQRIRPPEDLEASRQRRAAHLKCLPRRWRELKQQSEPYPIEIENRLQKARDQLSQRLERRK